MNFIICIQDKREHSSHSLSHNESENLTLRSVNNYNIDKRSLMMQELGQSYSRIAQADLKTQMSRSHMEKKSFDQGTSIRGGLRKLQLSEMRDKISGVEKMIKNRQREFLSPKGLRSSVGLNSPEPKLVRSPINSQFEQPVILQNQQLRSSWNDHLFIMFDRFQDPIPQPSSATISNRKPSIQYANTPTSKMGALGMLRKNFQEGVTTSPANMYSNDKNLTVNENSSYSIKVSSPIKNQSPQENKKKSQIFEQKSKQDKIRAHINKSMQILKLVKTSSQRQDRKTLKWGEIINGFQIGGALGKGKFGLVHLARHVETGFIAAIKKVQKAKIKQYQMYKQFSKEIRLHSSLDHPKIVKFYGFFQTQKQICLVIEYMNGGTLFEHLNRKGMLGVREAVDFLRDVILAVSYLHERSIAHRDIKPENIVISTQGVAKLCDLGWAAVMESSRNTYCGTLDYVCPQILQRKDYDLSVDIWSVGILAYEMLMGKAPFEDKDRSRTRQKILNVDANTFDYSPHVPQQAKQFIAAIVQMDPNKRPKINELFNFSLFTNYGSKQGKKLC